MIVCRGEFTQPAPHPGVWVAYELNSGDTGFRCPLCEALKKIQGLEFDLQIRDRERQRQVNELTRVLEAFDVFQFQPGSLQHATGSWATETFPQMTPRSTLEHLKTEVAELDEVLTELEVADVIEADELFARVQEEAADVMLLLYGLAFRMGFNLDLAAWAKYERNKRRKWKTTPEPEGFVKHEEEAAPAHGEAPMVQVYDGWGNPLGSYRQGDKEAQHVD